MTGVEDLVGTLNWILDTSDPRDLHPDAARLPWRLEVPTSNEYSADLDDPDPERFVIRVSTSVWPRLDAFCACGIDWKANARKPRSKVFNCSKEEWETIIRATQDSPDSPSFEASLSRLVEDTLCHKRVWSPLSLYAADETSLHAVAASCGFLWLVCHEGAHAWKRHYKLREAPIRESIRAKSDLFAGLELDRTYESEADWESTKFIYSYILECVVAGYSSAFAYAAGFGTAAAVLLLNPCRQGLWEKAGQHDPGWMRLHCCVLAAKAGYWQVAGAHYPKYVSLVHRQGIRGIMRPDSQTIAPKARFNRASDATRTSFWLGQFHAMRFATAMGNANETYRIAANKHFHLGEPYEWKDFQIMVMETEVLEKRRRARDELKRQLPADDRFGGFGPLGYGALIKMLFAAAHRKILRAASRKSLRKPVAGMPAIDPDPGAGGAHR